MSSTSWTARTSASTSLMRAAISARASGGLALTSRPWNVRSRNFVGSLNEKVVVASIAASLPPEALSTSAKKLNLGEQVVEASPP